MQYIYANHQPHLKKKSIVLLGLRSSLMRNCVHSLSLVFIFDETLSYLEVLLLLGEKYQW